MTAAREWPAIHLSKKLSRATVLLIAITEAAADATIAIVRRDRAIRTALAEGSLSAEMIAATTGMTVEQVMAAELSAWRDAFLVGGESSLKTRPADDRDVEIGRLSTRHDLDSR